MIASENFNPRIAPIGSSLSLFPSWWRASAHSFDEASSIWRPLCSPSRPVAKFEFDLLRHLASWADRPLDLTARELPLLDLRTRRHGRVLLGTKVALQVRDMSFDGDVNVGEVCRLRSEFDDPVSCSAPYECRRGLCAGSRSIIVVVCSP